MPLIIGGGPAGAAAAIRLARAGMRPVVVERSISPSDTLCGGFLSWTSVRLLQACGVDPMALGGHAIYQARLFAGRRTVQLTLPAPSAGLSRRALDGALLERAAQAGAILRRGVAVRAIEDGMVRYADGSSQMPKHLILATGKSDLRGAARPVESKDPAVGLRWRFRANEALMRALSDTIELHLFRRGYAGLVRQEAGFANLCLAVRHSSFVKAGRRPALLLAALLGETPFLAERLAGVSLGEAQAVANIPYGWRARDDAQHIYRVGDQIGVIASLAGEGVGIALSTGMAAADAILDGIDPQTYQAECSHWIAPPLAHASRLWSLAERPCLAGLALPLLATLPGLGSLAMRATRITANTKSR